MPQPDATRAIVESVSRVLGARRLEAEQGALIVVEGVRGAGKTTVVSVLASILRSLGLPVATAKHPSRTVVGALALELARTGHWLAAANVFIADMALTVYRGGLDISDDLRGGVVLIFDRYYYSTMVYQGLLAAGEDGLRVVSGLAGTLPPPHIIVHVAVDCGRAAYTRAARDGAYLDESVIDGYREECEAERRAYDRVLRDEGLLVPGQAWRGMVRNPGVFTEPTVIQAAGVDVSSLTRLALDVVHYLAEERGYIDIVYE